MPPQGVDHGAGLGPQPRLGQLELPAGLRAAGAFLTSHFCDQSLFLPVTFLTSRRGGRLTGPKARGLEAFDQSRECELAGERKQGRREREE